MLRIIATAICFLLIYPTCYSMTSYSISCISYISVLFVVIAIVRDGSKPIITIFWWNKLPLTSYCRVPMVPIGPYGLQVWPISSSSPPYARPMCRWAFTSNKHVASRTRSLGVAAVRLVRHGATSPNGRDLPAKCRSHHQYIYIYI